MFEDGGTAFVDALQKRKSSFGSLTLVDSLPLNDDNLKRLLQVDTIDHLDLTSLNHELDLLPFSAQVDYLDYLISSSSLLEGDMLSLNVVTNKLSLTIRHEDESFPTESMLSLFRQLAHLGHFV